MLDISQLDFHKSSYSSATQQNCVEVAETLTAAVVRDSTHPTQAHLVIGATEWRTFLGSIKDGQH